MAGDEWQKFANLRVLLAYQWLFPGKPLLFMGGEIGQSAEWNANAELDWWLLDSGPYHRGVQRLVSNLNQLYQAEPALWQADYDPHGFQWVDCSDRENSVMSFLRRSGGPESELLVVLNLTPVLRTGYRVGLPRGGRWREVLNTDAASYGGSNAGNMGGLPAEESAWQGQPCSVVLTLPPLSALVFKAPSGNAS
jgi:1,4-alpha-glucan branching enzyme